MKSLGFCLLAAVALGACGGSSAHSNPNSSPDAGPTPSSAPSIGAFNVSPGALPYGGGTATLSWSAADATHVSIEPGIGDVTGRVAVDISVASTTTFTVTASNARGSASAIATVTVSPTATVSGQVIDARGQPLSSATVVIGAQPPVVTDTAGQFSVSGLVPPFDAIAVAPDQQHVSIYRGLAATHPTLTVFTTPVGMSSAQIAGTVSGGITPYGTDNTPIAVFGSPDADFHGGPVSSTATFSLNVSWPTSGATTGTLLALQPARDSTGQVTGWLAYGRRDNVTLSPNDSLTDVTLPLTTLTPGALAGTVSAPAGYAVEEIDLNLQLQPTGTLQLQQDISGSSSFSFHAPFFPQSGCSIVAGALPPTRVNSALSIGMTGSVTAATSGLSLTLPPVPVQGTPVEGANSVDSNSTFSWSGAGTATVFDLRLTKTSSGTPLQLDVLTDQLGAQLPDLSPIGLGFVSGTAFSWQVTGFAPLARIDEAVSGGVLPALLQYRVQGSLARSDSRSFTLR